MSPPLDSTPERDRSLARQVRHHGRRAQSTASWIEQWVRSAEFKRLKRHRRIYSAIDDALPTAFRGHIQPVSIRKGTLLLAIDDNILLHELRNHYHHQLIEALIACGSGIADVRYKRASLRPRS